MTKQHCRRRTKAKKPHHVGPIKIEFKNHLERKRTTLTKRANTILELCHQLHVITGATVNIQIISANPDSRNGRCKEYSSMGKRNVEINFGESAIQDIREILTALETPRKTAVVEKPNDDDERPGCSLIVNDFSPAPIQGLPSKISTFKRKTKSRSAKRKKRGGKTKTSGQKTEEDN